MEKQTELFHPNKLFRPIGKPLIYAKRSTGSRLNRMGLVDERKAWKRAARLRSLPVSSARFRIEFEGFAGCFHMTGQTDPPSINLRLLCQLYSRGNTGGSAPPSDAYRGVQFTGRLRGFEIESLGARVCNDTLSGDKLERDR